MKEAKRTKGIYLRVSPEFILVVNKLRTQYSSFKYSQADIIHQAVKKYAYAVSRDNSKEFFSSVEKVMNTDTTKERRRKEKFTEKKIFADIYWVNLASMAKCSHCKEENFVSDLRLWEKPVKVYCHECNKYFTAVMPQKEIDRVNKLNYEKKK